MRTVVALVLLNLVFLSGCDRLGPAAAAAAAPDTTAPETTATTASNPAPRALRAYADAETGTWTLRLARTVVSQPSEFRLLELWRYEHDRKEWSKTEFQASATVAPPAEVDRAHTVPVPLDLSKAVPPKSIGLYFAKWTLDGKRHTGLLYVGNRYPDDYEIGPTPPGMIKAAVPFADSVVATFVPDPEIHCTSPAPGK